MTDREALWRRAGSRNDPVTASYREPSRPESMTLVVLLNDGGCERGWHGAAGDRAPCPFWGFRWDGPACALGGSPTFGRAEGDPVPGDCPLRDNEWVRVVGSTRREEAPDA